MMVILFVCFQSIFQVTSFLFFNLTVLSATLFILSALELSGAVSDKSAVSLSK